MIRIDRISFEFAATDEQFAHDLYANWDNFCHDSFEKVTEECLSSYDKDKVLYEMEYLELDLGSIPEEDFYREFPRRLKEELLKALPSWNIQTENERKKTNASRLENLLFYLEHGYRKTEWADCDFSLSQELDWAVSQQALYTEDIVKLCLKKEHTLRRILWQTNEEKALLLLFAVVLSRPSSGLQEKRRFLEILLEMKPAIPVRFIHEDTDGTRLHDMAELLDTLSVRRIMETETEEHAEIDLPPYWHYLYEWLIKYYPFNGLAIFGSKGDFIRHLHLSLLTFIRKRNYSFYLSKAELTIGFLLEVFGSAYYMDVLNAIYDLQPHHADGSPIYDGYLNRELYNMFLQLSLLRLPVVEKGKNTVSEKEQTVDKINAATLTIFLKDEQKSIAEKQIQLGLLAKERPEILVDWLQMEAFKDDFLIYAVAEMIDVAVINHLLASVSFKEMEIVDLVNMESYRVWLSGNRLNTIQTWLKSRWNADEGFTSWLEDKTVSADSKCELLQKIVVEKPHEWIDLLHRYSGKSNIVTLATPHLSASRLLQGMAHVDFRQAAVLSQTIEWLQHKAGEFTFLIGSNMFLSTALTRALLLFMQDKDTLGGKRLTEKEVVNKFLSHLYFVYMGKIGYEGNKEWMDLPGKIAIGLEMDGWQDVQENEIDEALSQKDTSDAIFGYYIRSIFDKQPDKLLTWLEKDASYSLMKRVADVSDMTMLERWIVFLYTVAGFEYPDDFKRLMGWIVHTVADWAFASEATGVLLLWIKETDWRKQTPQQMEEYFITRLILKTAKESIPLSVESPAKKEIIRSFVKLFPALNEKTEDEIRNTANRLKDTLNISEKEGNQVAGSQVDTPEILFVHNAGLCLLSPWISRLLDKLGYLDEDKRCIKDTPSKIRAVFLLQYLTNPEEKEYCEMELTFNRLLVALPMYIPLPGRLELSAGEKETADSMLSAVKAHWPKLSGTSMKGFRQSFIVRSGRLEQQEERWLLTVDGKVHDILLDSIPWAFRQIRFPWLKKHIQVKWHEKQEFNSEHSIMK